MKRKVQIELSSKGLTPEEMAILYLAIKPVIDDVMEFFGAELKGDEQFKMKDFRLFTVRIISVENGDFSVEHLFEHCVSFSFEKILFGEPRTVFCKDVDDVNYSYTLKEFETVDVRLEV